MGASRKEKTPIDMPQVGYVAQLENVGHFRVFEEAYEEWFGKEATMKELEHNFHPYLRTGVAPYWVRSYTRHVIADNRERMQHKAERDTNIASCAVTLTFLMTFSVLLHLWTSM